MTVKTSLSGSCVCGGVGQGTQGEVEARTEGTPGHVRDSGHHLMLSGGRAHVSEQNHVLCLDQWFS